MSSYRKGVKFEYELMHLFEDHGWLVIRSAGSRKIDLVCFKNGKVLVIECKRNWREYVDETRNYAAKSKIMGYPIYLVHKNTVGLSVIKIQPSGTMEVNFQSLIGGEDV